MRPDSHTQLPIITTACVLFVLFLFFPVFGFFGKVTFAEYFYTITITGFSLYGEYVARFFLPDGVFLPCDHGLDF